MSRILKFPTEYKGDSNEWMTGYIAGLADAKRGGFDTSELINESGLTKQDFIEAGADQYDIEDIFN